MATAYATKVSFSSGGMMTAMNSMAKTKAAKFFAGATGGATAGVAIEGLIEAGLSDIHTMTQGRSGEEFSLSQVLLTGAIGGTLGGVLTAPEVVGDFFKKVGEWIGLAPKNGKRTGRAPSAENPLGDEFTLPQQGSDRVAVTDAGKIRIDGEVTVYSSLGRRVFTAPPQESMFFWEAAQWYREQSVKIGEALKDADMPLNLKLQEAYKLRQAQLQAAKNALYDQELAERFAEQFRLDSLDTLVAEASRKTDISGPQLFGKVFEGISRVDNRINYPVKIDGCFSKGTAVHTKEGLKSIEEIKVGDWVLSAPEDGFGKPEYKRVLNTFVFKNKTIREIGVRIQGKTGAYFFGVTGNHPIWVEGIGWRRADKVKEGDIVRLADGGSTKITKQFPVFCTEEPGVGWVQNVKHPVADPANGLLFDYENYQLVPDQEAEYDYLEALDSDPPPFLEVTVYNLEVEDFHTYYVTPSGVWVHNADCSGLKPFEFEGKPRNEKTVVPSNIEQYPSSKELGQAISKGQIGKNGFAVVPAPKSGMKITKTTKRTTEDLLEGGGDADALSDLNAEALLEGPMRQRWLRFEDDVVGRLQDKNGNRYEYAVIYENAKIRGRNYIHVEGHEIVNGQHVFVDPGHQDIDYEGPAYVTDLLEMSDIEWTLGQAKQYWIDAGVVPSALEGVHFSITDLPDRTAGIAEGRTITLDASGVGWGWFVDNTLENAEEFALVESATNFRATMEAYKLRQAQRQAAMNALGDQELAAEFGASYPLDSLEKIKNMLMREKDLSGEKLDDAVYDALTTAKMRTTEIPGGCFTKGTLVHTREGLRPIEEIKVGDYVLSSPEDGSGKPEYKPVVNTFVFRNRTIKDVAYLENPDDDRSYWFNATGDHPFWVEGVGWTRADALKEGDVLRKADGSFGKAIGCRSIFRLPEWHKRSGVGEGIGWVYDGCFFVDVPDGVLFDYENNCQIPNSTTYFYVGEMVEENYLEVTVYNIEVADFHTYYVGEAGIWVHNNNCMAGAKVIKIGERDFVEFPNGERAPHYRSVKDYETAVKQKKQQIEKGEEVVEPSSEDGRVVIRQTQQGRRNGVKNDISLEGSEAKDLEKWRQFERASEHSLVVDEADGRHYQEIGLAFDNPNGNNVILFEAYDSLTQTFIDRKMALAKPSSKTVRITGEKIEILNPQALYGVLEWLDRATKALDKNPGKVRVEMPLSVQDKPAGINAKELWHAIQSGNLNFIDKIKRIDANGNYVRNSKNEFVFDYVERTDAEALAIMKNIKRMFDEGRIEKEIKFVPDPVYHQDMYSEGPAYVTDLLEMSDIEWTLGQAKQYWIDAGVVPSALEGVHFSITDLPDRTAGIAEGRTITLDASGVGWGWFVDNTLENAEEFALVESATNFRATTGSPAYDKIDLLTVMIHELGHVLGLPSISAAGEIMSQYLSPGERRLPDAGIVRSLPLALRTSSAVMPNPELTNAQFTNGDDWLTTGDVRFSNGEATLKESAATQTRLNQVFVVGTNDRYLRFKITDLVLDDADNAPDDAFEAALIDANTGLSLLSGTGLTKNDAFINLQANGDTFKSNKVTAIDNPDGSRMVIVDLEGVPRGHGGQTFPLT